MKKYLIIILLPLVLISCNSNDSEAVIQDLESKLELNNTQINNLKNEVLQRDNDINKLMEDLESTKLEFEDYLELKERFNAQTVEIEALQNRIGQIEFDTSEAQINFEVDILSFNDDKLSYVFKEAMYPYAQQVIVIGHDFNSSIEEVHKVEVLELGDNLYEAISLDVKGSIYDFEWVEIKWDDTFTEHEDINVLSSTDYITNKKVIINTTLSEGIPSQLIRWKNSEGKEYKVYMSYDGFGLEAQLIISK